MKQHYIPRCYLRRFSDNDKSINTYDKINSKKYRASLMSVCCDNDLYTLSDEYVKKSREEDGSAINNLTIEKGHFAGVVEPLYSQLLLDIDKIQREWVSGTDCYRLNYYEKAELALHVATQYLRHPLIVDAEVNNYLRLEQASVDMVKSIMASQSGNEGLEKMEIKVECEKPALHAMMTYMNYDELMKCAAAMAENFYIFWVSKGGDFYTSDFPVAVESHVNDAGHSCRGLSIYGGELMMSLSPSLALSIYDRHYFKSKEDMDGFFIVADDKEVRRRNMMNYFYAQRHVFSRKNDFSLIEFIHHKEGKHIYLSPNLKAEIISGLGRY